LTLSGECNSLPNLRPRFCQSASRPVRRNCCCPCRARLRSAAWHRHYFGLRLVIECVLENPCEPCLPLRHPARIVLSHCFFDHRLEGRRHRPTGTPRFRRTRANVRRSRCGICASLNGPASSNTLATFRRHMSVTFPADRNVRQQTRVLHNALRASERSRSQSGRPRILCGACDTA
jgi:hypothetical protein